MREDSPLGSCPFAETFLQILKPFLDDLYKKKLLRNVPDYTAFLTARGPV